MALAFVYIMRVAAEIPGPSLLFCMQLPQRCSVVSPVFPQPPMTYEVKVQKSSYANGEERDMLILKPPFPSEDLSLATVQPCTSLRKDAMSRGLELHDS